MTELLASLAIKPVRKGVQVGRWVWIRKGPHKRILCSCGAGIEDMPHDFEQTLALGTCAHLEALYTGRITEDVREARLYGSRFTMQPAPRYYVRLTQLGSRMFRWRWAAQALSSCAR